MKLSKLWLQDWVSFGKTEKELAHQLTMAGLEVDGVSPVAGEFSQVIVAQILATKAHPDADKLTLCEVDAHLDQPLNIVCGASNVRPGLKVALAMIGARLPGGLKIKETKLRGQLSQGMLCSVTELGMAESSEGIMELADDAPVGADLRDYLSLDDAVFEIDLTPNRADCFSVLGIAREVAALNQTTLHYPDIQAVQPQLDDTLTIHLDNPQACPRYCGRMIRGIDSHATTPLWMSERLRRSGLRLVHPVVDVMNYVMLELGQPMHAFDVTQLQGTISVRNAKPHEQLKLLDGQTVTLNESVLVIADEQKSLAMAGIMGGAESAVEAHTRDVFLESAFFNPLSISGIARQYGLSSDSSQRYERGVDPGLQRRALERATNLLLSIVGGQAGPVVELCEEQLLPKSIHFNFDTTKVQQLTGVDIPVTEMIRLLDSLEIRCVEQSHTVICVSIPSHRFDLQQDVDLVEEIIRLYGYDQLHSQAMMTETQVGHVASNELLSMQLATWFRSKGYRETISYSFVDPELQASLYPDAASMQLLNPISSELSHMRVGMWPGLLASMLYNVHRQKNALKIFETGVIFEVIDGQLTEKACIAGLIMGEYGALNWSDNKRYFDFYDLKGDLQSLFTLLKLEQVTFTSDAHQALHPGQSARIMIDEHCAGWIGALHPRLSDALDLPHDVFLFELNLATLNNAKPASYKTISKYPQIRRDLSFLIDKEINISDVETAVRAVCQEGWLKSFDVFDVYMGKGIPLEKKSVAISILLQDTTRTLVDAEINSLISAIIKTLEDKFSILLRE